MLEYKRGITVYVADLIIQHLKIDLEIKRESSSTPASGNIVIYNLSRQNEQRIVDRSHAISVLAGYADRQAIIFDGNVQRVERERNISAKTRTTTLALAARTVSNEVLSGVSTIAFVGARPLKSVASLLVADMDLKLGPLDGIPDEKVEDYSYSGASTTGLTALLEPRGVNWFEDDGQIRFNRATLPRQPDYSAITLSKHTGLIGAPTVTDKGVKARSLLKPLAKIGGEVIIESPTAAGAYKTVSLLHQGTNWKGDFFTEFDLRPIEVGDGDQVT